MLTRSRVLSCRYQTFVRLANKALEKDELFKTFPRRCYSLSKNPTKVNSLNRSQFFNWSLFSNKEYDNDNKVGQVDLSGKKKAIVKIDNDREAATPAKNITNDNIPTPKMICAYLDKWVIGQTLSKKMLSLQVYSHYRRLLYNSKQEVSNYMKERRTKMSPLNFMNRFKENESNVVLKEIPNTNKVVLDKSNIMLIGPTGTGKTFMAELLSKYLNVPLVICDCTTLTKSGYVGEDVSSIINKLYIASNYDVEKTQKGIIFLDEVDKIAAKSMISNQLDVGGTGVQQELLKLIEGKHVKITSNVSQFSNISNSTVDIDTKNILFIASGSFGNIEEIIKSRLRHNIMGFKESSNTKNPESLKNITSKLMNNAANETKLTDYDKMIQSLNTKDLIKFGLIPEFVGRFPVIAPLHSVYEDMLVDILTKPQNSILKQYEEIFKIENCKLTITDGALKQIAKRAYETETGVRGIRSIMEKLLLETRFELPKSNIIEIKITEDTIINNKKPELIPRGEVI